MNFQISKFPNLQIILLLFLFISCKQAKINYPEKADISGLASPVVFMKGETKILLTDYFTDVAKIDSVVAEKAFTVKLSEDKKSMTLTTKDINIPNFSNIKVWIKGFPYSIPAKKSMKVNYNFLVQNSTFKIQVQNKVQLAGDFNSWNPEKTNLINKEGKWQTELVLNPGKYNYQLVVDGKWMLDPDNPETASNNIGGFNSVLNIKAQEADKLPEIYTNIIQSGAINIESVNSLEEYFIYWENFRLADKFVSLFNPQTKNPQLFINIPSDAKKFNRSYIRVWAVNKFGYSNDLLIPLEYGKVINNKEMLTRNDPMSMVMYFLMVDRFNNADKKNDKPVNDPEVDFKANYQGGDLAGVEAKINDSYFAQLGINTIWLSPISQNPYQAYVEFPAPHRKYSGYHGYWPISSIKVDTRFGTDKEFKKLVNTAHDKNINIIMDYVSHHVHKEHTIYKKHPDWITPLDLPDGTKNIRIWDAQRLTTWFDTFLPTLDFTRPEVVEMESDSAMFWVKQYGIDGFRHDATKHVPEVFWRRLTEKIKTQASKPVYQIGETFGSRELIGSYINSGELDAQFDFNLYFDARSAFAIDKEPFTKLATSMQETFDYYGYHNLMGNITGNHDLPRFITLASGDLAFNEDDKEAGWKRKITVTNPIAYNKLSCLTAFIMTIPGIPIIYYGDEFGMPGAGDPDNRRFMKFDNLTPNEKQVKLNAEKLIKLRRQNLPLIFGDTRMIDATDKTLVFLRTYFDDIAIIVFNKDSAVKSISFNIPERFKEVKLNSNFGSKVNANNGSITLEVKPYSFEILTK